MPLIPAPIIITLVINKLEVNTGLLAISSANHDIETAAIQEIMMNLKSQLTGANAAHRPAICADQMIEPMVSTPHKNQNFAALEVFRSIRDAKQKAASDKADAIKSDSKIRR